MTSEALLPIEVPLFSAGAPLPHVFADEGRLVIAYLADAPDPSFDGTNPRPVSPLTGNQPVAMLTADPYLAFQFGPPNDEAISGHRLHPLGLRSYEAFEVLHSSWVASLEKANRVHSSHKPELFSGYRHFILTFHDSTLEFIAESFSASLHKGAVLTVLLKSVGHRVP
ncbi:hypothetical protein EN829_014270 [Mesorhizobium sp. M00.F.Ca.ET.186.01.1.1]|nr:hypothetical protein EN848_15155 [bacterium M00.F.Ca.ET.205.01.1.1]TGU52856.1 hypothetical protein EN795_14240 [bacterium M00.F.Ca.ET.152.01.1.1]TGV35827.1 hypothetical protein EN829_014270 [Mesorhizobium sp. M00.F.Ca.ET.186.01.1.1]TGZ43408.1 hypothetical protein EN805_09850 [bacterium M00.F.Ca.ET.162.01.1.1]